MNDEQTLRIDALIEQLQALRAAHGNLPVRSWNDDGGFFQPVEVCRVDDYGFDEGLYVALMQEGDDSSVAWHEAVEAERPPDRFKIGDDARVVPMTEAEFKAGEWERVTGPNDNGRLLYVPKGWQS